MSLPSLFLSPSLSKINKNMFKNHLLKHMKGQRPGVPRRSLCPGGSALHFLQQGQRSGLLPKRAPSIQRLLPALTAVPFHPARVIQGASTRHNPQPISPA